MSVLTVADNLTYRMNYKSHQERESLMQRRKQSIDLSVRRGDDVSFSSHLLSDCSPFTEWVWRNIKGTRND